MVGELTEKEIADFFSQQNFGHLGCSDGSRMYVVPTSYIYRGDHILCHSRGGMKIDIMRQNPSVCFQVEKIDNYTHWKSLIAWGNYEEIKDKQEIEDAQKQFGSKELNIKFSLFRNLQNDEPVNGQIEKASPTEVVFYRIKLTGITGRYELEGITSPGSYL